jgi:S-formylglutathione hydrolase FrmB
MLSQRSDRIERRGQSSSGDRCFVDELDLSELWFSRAPRSGWPALVSSLCVAEALAQKADCSSRLLTDFNALDHRDRCGIIRLHSSCFCSGAFLGASVALALATRHPAMVQALVLASGYYFPSARGDVVAQAGPAVPGLGDVFAYTLSARFRAQTRQGGRFRR